MFESTHFKVHLFTAPKMKSTILLPVLYCFLCTLFLLIALVWVRHYFSLVRNEMGSDTRICHPGGAVFANFNHSITTCFNFFFFFLALEQHLVL